MLQAISPHLTIDREAFSLFVAQYKRWLFRIRYACTFNHPNTLQKMWSYVPKLPMPSIFGGGGKDLQLPPRAPPHTHENFDFSWGTGPLVDSFTAMYYLNGMHVRMPGHESVEIYNEKSKANKWTKIRELGHTNEYIHPITYFRSLVRGWEKYSPLQKPWNREAWEGKSDGKMRFWWYMDGEQDTCALPEWSIMPHGQDEEFNFERKWYSECEKTEKTLDKLASVAEFGEGQDFLDVLDEELNFDMDNRPQRFAP